MVRGAFWDHRVDWRVRNMLVFGVNVSQIDQKSGVRAGHENLIFVSSLVGYFVDWSKPFKNYPDVRNFPNYPKTYPGLSNNGIVGRP